ncbi:Nramp-domain-containing protein [Dentipellis sp. KUC8613]|nr:Nramp-domain-containing protein [Dentipellis sp. KUC8613]
MPSPLALQIDVNPVDPPLEAVEVKAGPSSGWKTRSSSVLHRVVHHVKRHAGVGVICAVAYFDPGNWSVDMQAGSIFGYRPMLFVILMAGLGAVVLQAMACRLGCITGLDLATHCRLLLHNHPRHRYLIRYGVLYPLYVLCEISIISTDLAELLGSAIGLCLLFPKLPLWAAVLLTASDVMVFLVIGDPTRAKGRPVRLFEFSVIALVGAVFVSFVVLLVQVKADWPEVLLGFIPSKKLVEVHPNAVYTAVGILGATVMPHALFLGSFLSTQDRVSTAPSAPTSLPMPASSAGTGGIKAMCKRTTAWARSLFVVSRAERVAASRDHRNQYSRPDNNTVEFIRSHLGHSIFDIVASLLGVAVPINAAILIIAATVFFRDDMSSGKMTPAGLFDAHDLIKAKIGSAAAFIFALALLCAGQTASITATLAGQIVSEGFIQWRISPFLRRLVTRLLGLIPSMIVAIAVGRPGIDTLLVASQVALSIVLPFVVFPLVYITSSSTIMSATEQLPPSSEPPSPNPDAETPMSPVVKSEADIHIQEASPRLPDDPEIGSVSGVKTVDYSNGRVMKYLGYAIWLIVVTANAYVLVELALGTTVS